MFVTSLKPLTAMCARMQELSGMMHSLLPSSSNADVPESVTQIMLGIIAPGQDPDRHVFQDAASFDAMVRGKEGRFLLRMSEVISGISTALDDLRCRVEG
jgi:hypothetical protein